MDSKKRRRQRRLLERNTDESKAVNLVKDKVETSETKPDQGIFASRERSVDFVSTLLNALPNPDPVLSTKGETIEVYNELLYDSRVIATTDSRKSAIKSMEWDVTSETKDQASIDFHKEYLKKWEMERIVSEILDAPLFGYKPNEIMWQAINGQHIPVDFVGKPPHWFTYDDQNELRMFTSSNMIEGEIVPPNKFIVSRSKATYENPFGVGILSACFWPVLFRRNGLKFLSVFVEKYGMPFLVGTAPAGEKVERMKEILEMLENIIQDGVAVVPEDYKLEVLEGKEGKGAADSIHKVFLDIMNNEIALAVLGTNLTTNVEGGSFAAASAHMEVRADIVESDQRLAEGTINKVLRLTHEINFGNPDDAPVFRLFAEEKIDKTRAERDAIIVKADPRVKFTDKYYQDKHNLAPDDYALVEAKPAPAGKVGVKDE